MKTFKESLNQVKDKGEYDQEGGMAKGQLKTMLDAAKELHDMFGDDDNLPEWVQGKITKATDYIDSARDYMKSQTSQKEEVVAELSTDKMKQYFYKSAADAANASRDSSRYDGDPDAASRQDKRNRGLQRALKSLKRREK